MIKLKQKKLKRHHDESHEDWLIRTKHLSHLTLSKNGYILTPRFYSKIKKVELQKKSLKVNSLEV
jgi:hypothetical protein